MSNKKIVEFLQKAVAMELTAAHQYQLHAHVLMDWGLARLAAQMREEMQDELGHSDAFMERIMFLKGTPELAFDKPPRKADTLVDMFKSDLADEDEAIVLDEEGHKGWLELQLGLIERLGEKAYSAKFMTIGEADEA
jgi:bacterioferritin